MSEGFMFQACVYLAAAVIAAPLAIRLGGGSLRVVACCAAGLLPGMRAYQAQRPARERIRDLERIMLEELHSTDENRDAGWDIASLRKEFGDTDT